MDKNNVIDNYLCSYNNRKMKFVVLHNEPA